MSPKRLQAVILLLAGLGLVLMALTFVSTPALFWRAYATALFAWTTLPVGAIAFLLVHQLMGGALIARFGTALQALARSLVVPALLFLPLLLDLPAVFPWARQDYVTSHPPVAEKLAYLNPFFFSIRALMIWAVLLALAFLLSSSGDRLEAIPRRRAAAGIGAVLWTLAASFAAIDWIMSLEPLYYSSAFGTVFMAQAALAAYAAAVLLTLLPAAAARRADLLREERLIGTGSLMLALILIWAYCSFTQFLVTWSGNTPHTALWFVERSEHGWRALIFAVMILKGALPFLVLLVARARQSWRILAGLSCLILLMQLIEMIWMIVPSFSADGGPRAWQVVGAMLGIGGLWSLALVSRLRRIGDRSSAEPVADGGAGHG